MLYSYYMKINLRYGIFSFLIFFLPVLLHAQITVVLVQDKKVYLDTSSLSRPVHKGETFKLILAAEKLVNPKTGKDLGNIYQYSAAGKITEVQPLYAVGALPEAVTAQVGQEAVLEEPENIPQPTKAPVPAAVENSQKKKIIYTPVEQTIISLSQGPVLADGDANIVTLSKQGQVTVWTRNGENLQEKAAYTLEKNTTPLAVSAVPLSTPGQADVFVSYFDTRQNQISTTVLRYQAGQLTAVATLPYYVKEQGCGSEKTVWAQRAFWADAYPGNAQQLLYKNDQFTRADTTRVTRRNWLNATAWAPLENEQTNNLIYTAGNGKITLLLANGKRAESKDLFAASPNRVKYKQEIVKFYPSLQVIRPAGQFVVAGVENTAKFGLLSTTFGQYERGKIHFLSYEKGRLKVIDSVEMDGVVYDLACSNDTLLGAEVLEDGTSSVVEIFN